MPNSFSEGLVPLKTALCICRRRFKRCPDFQYWHDPLNYRDYVQLSRYLADVNNEGVFKNVTYFKNLTKLKKFVMVKNLNVS
jgi:ribosomal protein S18